MEGELHFTRGRGTTSLFWPNQRAIMTWGRSSEVSVSRRVPVDTIDAWARREDIGPIEVFKLDIQAGELLALHAADRTLRQEILVVYTEVFFNPMYEGGALFSEIDLLLRERGFLLYDIYKPAVDSRGMLLNANPIYLHGVRLGFSA